MKSKKLIMIIIYIVIGVFIVLPSTSKAVVQANGGTPATKKINDWLLQIRQMQATGGALGLTDTINEDLTSSNKNLDIHMEKNTEYGAMAILSASAYGKQDKINDGETTTGNSTGIKININREWVSAGCEIMSGDVSRFRNSSGRYKNIYSKGTVGGRVGDAIMTLGTWHGPTDCKWYGGDSEIYSALIRSREGSLFSYYAQNGTGIDSANYNRLNNSRAVVVVGSGV